MVRVVLALGHPPYPRRHFHILHVRVVQPATAQSREVGVTAQTTLLPHHLRCRLSYCFPREGAFVKAIARARLGGTILVVGGGLDQRRRCSAALQGQAEEL
jgi:hypothetical protein